MSTTPIVVITESGPTGSVTYNEPGGSLSFYWEFGGGDTLAIITVGTMEEWRQHYAWAVPQRTRILRFVADEVVRQKAASCTAEIDELRGDIVLRQTGAGATRVASTQAPDPQAKAQAFVRRYTKLKAMVGLGLLVVALVVGALFWVGKKVLLVSPASGVPLGECVRTDKHISSLIQTTDPHMVEISGRGGNTTTSVSIVLIPLDGSKPQVVPVVGGLSPSSYSLARIMGSDGRTLWFDATGLYGVRLDDYELITAKDLRKANASLDPTWWEDPRGMDIIDGKLHIMRIDRSAAVEVDPTTWRATSVTPKPSNARFERHDPSGYLAAGWITPAGTWLGLHSPEEMEKGFKVGKWIRPVERADDAKLLRRLCTAELEPNSDDEHRRIRTIAPVSDTEYLNAAFLRMGDNAEPVQLNDPDGTLMIHTSKPGLGGTVIISRVDLAGTMLWKVDTGLDRFALQQILPGTEAFAFVGTRPPIEGKLSEPLVLLVDNVTGKVTTTSLWK